MKNNYKVIFTLLAFVIFIQSAIAQKKEQPTSIGTTKGILEGMKMKAEGAPIGVSNSTINLQVSKSKNLNGKINFKKSQTDSEFLVGEIENVPSSSFFLKVSETSLEGHIILKSSKQAYQYTSDKNGNAFVTKVDINKLICIDYEHQPEKSQTQKSTSSS